MVARSGAGNDGGRKWHDFLEENREKFKTSDRLTRLNLKCRVLVTTRKFKDPPRPIILFAKEKRAKLITWQP